MQCQCVGAVSFLLCVVAIDGTERDALYPAAQATLLSVQAESCQPAPGLGFYVISIVALFASCLIGSQTSLSPPSSEHSNVSLYKETVLLLLLLLLMLLLLSLSSLSLSL